MSGVRPLPWPLWPQFRRRTIPIARRRPGCATRWRPALDGRPAIAVVIDDLGLNRRKHRGAEPAQGAAHAGVPALCARARASRRGPAHAAGHELMLHLPMEPTGHEWPGPNALISSLAPPDLVCRLRAQLLQLPGLRRHQQPHGLAADRRARADGAGHGRAARARAAVPEFPHHLAIGRRRRGAAHWACRMPSATCSSTTTPTSRDPPPAGRDRAHRPPARHRGRDRPSRTTRRSRRCAAGCRRWSSAASCWCRSARSSRARAAPTACSMPPTACGHYVSRPQRGPIAHGSPRQRRPARRPHWLERAKRTASSAARSSARALLQLS